MVYWKNRVFFFLKNRVKSSLRPDELMRISKTLIGVKMWYLNKIYNTFILLMLVVVSSADAYSDYPDEAEPVAKYEACRQDGSVIMLKTLLQPAWLNQELSPIQKYRDFRKRLY